MRFPAMLPARARSARGQTLIIVAVGMVALIGMVGVVIDVGLQWADNRGAQNGSDAAAEAGAVVLLENMAGSPKTGADVLSAVASAASVNRISVEDAEYTDWQGNTLGIDVGPGTIPGAAQGVLVVGSRTHETLFARIVGVTELRVFTDAIAVAGPAEPCPPGTSCALLPVTFPTTIVTCDGQNKSQPTDDPWIGAADNPENGVPEYIVPLCGNNPGSVGWIDWTPPPGSTGPGGAGGGGGGGGAGGGGSAELAAEICDPNPPDLALPDWFYVTSTGNTNASTVQDCFNRWVGKTILIPLFEDTCRVKPNAGAPCPDAAPPAGVNQWYYFPQYAAFSLTGAYIQGNNSSVCDPSGGNGATTCLTGRFENAAITGTVGQWPPPASGNPPPSTFFAVQLIR
jgi:hypothetical protein